MDRAQFDRLILPMLELEFELHEAALGRLSPAAFDAVLRGCFVPEHGDLPDPKETFEEVEVTIDDRPFEGPFWEGIRTSNPEYGQEFVGRWGPCRLRVIVWPFDGCRPGTEFSASIVCADELGSLLESVDALIEYAFQWVCACSALAKLWGAEVAELDGLTDANCRHPVIWLR